MSKKLSSFDEFKAELRGLLEKHNVYLFEYETHDEKGKPMNISTYYVSSGNGDWPIINLGTLVNECMPRT